MVDDAMIARLRDAAVALNEGDPDPFLSLLASDAEWRGLADGHLWWKRVPS